MSLLAISAESFGHDAQLGDAVVTILQNQPQRDESEKNAIVIVSYGPDHRLPFPISTQQIPKAIYSVPQTTFL
ncbi:hypothetical protein CAter282_2419 [Collimonas arenae]|uniref:Uncharacterized protein n=1 Tax=Collimonas arenae TaxID=279058 RepID=A0A127QK60_9BURK|nr:hypothetical protein CAter282_2419 [Collimonas arenae]